MLCFAMVTTLAGLKAAVDVPLKVLLLIGILIRALQFEHLVLWFRSLKNCGFRLVLASFRVCHLFFSS